MEIKFSCSEAACGQHMTVDGSAAGRWLKCPACGKIQRVPGDPVPDDLPRATLVKPAAPPPATPSSSTAKKTSQDLKYPGLKRLLWGWGVGAAVLILVLCATRLYSTAALPRHFDEVLDEISSSGEIRMAPLVNNEGNRVLYARNVENGVGFFLLDLTTSRLNQIYLTDLPERSGYNFFNLFGWSPNDQYVAFSTTTAIDQPNREMTICNGATGAIVKSITLLESIRQATWLTSDSMALQARSGRLYLLNLKANPGLGQFGGEGMVLLKEIKTVTNRRGDSGVGLARLSDTMIAFVEDGNIYSLKIPANEIRQWTSYTNAVITWPAFDEKTDKFLFCLSETNRPGERYLYQLDLHQVRNGPVRLTSSYTYKGQWVNNGAGFSYVGTKGHVNFLAVEMKNNSPGTNLFLDGHVRGYSVSPRGDKLYAVAAMRHEPLGLWEYTLADGHLRNVLPGTGKPFKNSRIVAPINIVATNADGRRINYFILPPANFDPHKKYPAVVEQPLDSRWSQGSQIIANAGIFYASINASGLASFDENRETAMEDFQALNRELLKNPNVDPDRLYIAGMSWASGVVSKIIEIDPSSWRGGIMLSSVGFPRIPDDSPNFPSILVSIGLQEPPDRIKACEQFSREACIHLASAKVLYHKNAAHKFESNRLVRERYQEVVKFILTDY